MSMRVKELRSVLEGFAPDATVEIWISENTGTPADPCFNDKKSRRAPLLDVLDGSLAVGSERIPGGFVCALYVDQDQFEQAVKS